MIKKQGLKVSKAAMKAAGTLDEKADLVLDASYTKGVDLFSVDQLAEMAGDRNRQALRESPDNRIRLKAIGGGGGKGQRILDAPWFTTKAALQKN
ncbi:MAG: hypothetical protein ACNYPE_02320 [Candidatus Azotimanducaceae bacterium WSBS_2022_MAG_OTU7]